MLRRPVVGILVAFLFSLGCSVGTDGEDIDGDVISADAGMHMRDGGMTIVPPMIDAGPLPEGCVPEDCENAFDDDCDGRVNEDCPCLPGESRSCYRGRPETEGHGACAAGTMVCMEGLEFGTWGDCTGDVLPDAEVCDVAELDEDCDGAANEGCECTGAEPIPCGSDVGECGLGTQECIDGLRGECLGATTPMPEVCNGADDDCDGVDDDELFRNCGSAIGECAEGSQACIDGVWDACVGSRDPAEEACDGLDNDCDGMTDEDLIRPCGSTVGACLPGMQQCNAGSWSMCEGETGPTLEDCNGVDDDCNGMVDDGLTRQCGTDIGTCTLGTEACEGGAWTACVGGTGPGTEVCEGILDEDCDGTVDDGCGCTNGTTRSCGSDVGACEAGTETCVTGAWGACTGATAGATEVCDNVDNDCDGQTDEGLTRGCGTDTGTCSVGTETCSAGSWGSCLGSIGPRAETCDGSLDEDCDGVVDDGCACTDGQTRGCGTDVGWCVAGTERCDLTGTWGACMGQTGPRVETCNNVDDDCDGSTDEMLSQTCGTDVGACQSGTQVCSAGGWGTCSGSIGPTAEICDGLIDDDCDGTVDDGCGCTNGTTRGCGSDTGACQAGTETCVSGAWGTCTGAIGPASETCDGVDNDCDGSTDENITRQCGTNVGVCRFGTETCSAGSWGTCSGGVQPSAEVCEGTRDEDCDGTVDDGCTCVNGATRACGTDVGACMAGSQLCSSGAWGTCTGGTGPTTETCNNVDDDCDGSTDEMLTQTCGTDVGACQSGTQTCSAGGWGTCSGSIGPVAERCDGVIDDDCDGLVDEGCNCITGTMRQCGATDVGACAFGTETCSTTGNWGACVGYVGPQPETCNNIDDDCDGNRDDGVARSCGTDVGACVAGTEVCSMGSWGTCTGSVGPITERCDGIIDDDCDGVIDDGCNCVTGTTRNCGTATGACEYGTETCSTTGNWGTCSGGVGPVTETCNNVDDDCDGSIDESLSRQCGTDVGSCTYGAQSCSAGAWGTCTGGITPVTEQCDATPQDDEDCDGLTNEGCACVNGQTQQCGTTTGRCEYGTQTCNLSGVWGTCTGGIGPTTEICNALDDDCDAMTDEGGVCTSPVVMCPAGMTAEVLTTVTLSASGSDPDGGAMTYMWTVTERPLGSTSNPTSPTSATTGFFLDAAGTYTLRFCATDNEGIQACCTVTVVSTAPGTLHVELQWNTAYGDADLHLRANSFTGQGWWTGYDCFFGNRSTMWPPAGGDNNATLDRDDTNGYGPENITIDQNPVVGGTYRVGVHYYCNRSLAGRGGNSEPCCAPGSGAATATVRVYCGGILRWTSSSVSLRNTDDWVNVADVTWTGTGTLCNVSAVNSTTTGMMTRPAGQTFITYCQ